MLVFILRRIALSIPVFIGITFICFAVLSAAPGDPVRIVMGQHYNAEVAERLRAEWGLDQPFLVQYGRFAWRVAHGDLGRSYLKRTDVAPFLADKFRNTLLLTLIAMSIAITFGLSAGILSAVYARRTLDTLVMIVAVIGISMPIFWLGMMLQLLFAGKLGWLPVSGISDPGDMASQWSAWQGDYVSFLWHYKWRYWILPGVTLATIPMAVIARLSRSSMLEVLSQDYIRTARANGLSESRVVLVHALRNALIPIITVIGNNFAVLLTGAVLTETVFSWPGLGRTMVEAISQYDYPIVLGGVIIMAGVFVLVNLVVDLTYGLIDPRVRAA
ncbi:MAG: ABC transporter permease [bacterium]|nr:ABC transporter permease [bacterium]